MIGIYKAYSALTPEQKDVLQHKFLRGTYPPRALIEMLRPLAEFDKKSDKARVGVGCTGAALLVAGGILACANPFGNAVSFILATPCILAAIALIVLVTKLATRDLSNNFRLVALPFFAVLQEEMEPGRAIEVNLDLSSPTSKDKLVRKGEPYARGAYHKVVDSFYEDEWFQGSAKLADGSKLSWAIAEEITESACTKRNARGKHKTKTKYRKRVRITVDVGLPSKAYDIDVDGATHSGTRIQTRPGEKRTTLRVTRRVKIKSNEPVHPRVFLDLVADAYRRARPVEGGAS
jgi:hypothetical protein